MEIINWIMVVVGVGLILFGLHYFKKGLSFTVDGNPYIFSGLMKKRKVIILNEDYPEKIKKITEGVFGEQGLWLTKEKKLVRNILIDKDIYVLLELPDGSLVPTTFVVFKKDNKKKSEIYSGFLMEEFHKYNRLLNHNIEKVELMFKEKKLTIFDNFIEQVKRNAGIIALIGSILVLTLATTLLNVSQATEIVKPHTQILNSLETCQNTLQTCVQNCGEKQPEKQQIPTFPLYNEVIK